MSDPVSRLQDIRGRIDRAAGGRAVDLVAVSKTFEAEDIRPVLEAGCRIFGENRVQEAKAKWPGLRGEFDEIELHLIGPLQSNKAAEAVALFDVIETVDREKIAREISRECGKQGRHPRLYVQVNIGQEDQKAGVAPDEAVAFVARCREEHGLSIEGLMAIPPFDGDPAPHFARLADLARQAGLDRLSMGMSGDFETAVRHGATSVRVGSAIFGGRG